MRKLFLLFACVLLLNSLNITAQREDDPYIRSDRLGITHISLSTEITPEARYQQALALGAGWNRWPLYWDRIQTDEETWDWSAFDRQVLGDYSHGLNINAILIGRPQFYADENSIAGLNEPIFADGSDLPGPEGTIKELNPENPWTLYVQQAVERYKPGGILAEQAGLPITQGISIWEVWNEPDYTPFWQGSVREYARLLKVSYIVIKQTDPEAQVMFGGLLYPTENNWLALVLNTFVNDPSAAQFNYYMDIVAVHNYGDPWRSGWLTLYARETLDAFGLQRPIWMNETGIPTWDDYPGPVWEPSSVKRGTTQQQAWFLIQSAAYAWSEGAEKIFYHQLYDDCGDQPAGTNFPPHSGNLCSTNGEACFGDAFGIYRNHREALCFSQHPQPGSARPVAQAYRLLAEIFGTEAFSNGDRVYLDENFITFTFDRPRTEERLTVMWNRTTDLQTLTWEAVGEDGHLISLDSDEMIQPNDEGVYTISLTPALADTDVSSSPVGGMAIGGSPHILIERVDGSVDRQVIDLSLDGTSSTAALPTQADLDLENTIVQPTLLPRPTVDPANDTRAPSASIGPLLPISPATFTVSWQGTDDSGIDHYLIWVRVNGDTWLPWLETSDTSAEYTGVPGNTYEFSAWAVDLAGNWTEGATITAQASTQVE